MKRSLSRAAALFASLLVFLCPAACGGKSEAVRVVVREKSERLVAIEAAATGGSLADALEALRDAGEIDFAFNGTMLVSLNGFAPEGNEYWAIYTSLGERGGAVYSSDAFGSIEYGGETLYSAAYGAAELPLFEGEIYVFKVTAFSE